MRIRIEVVYAEPVRQLVHRTEVAEDTTVAQVLDEACATTAFAGINWREHVIGVFGVVCEPTRKLSDGDRVEIYRPLVEDARSARRRRASQNR